MKVEIWSDIYCPWCYIGKRRFERALADFPGRAEVEVVHRSFQLDPMASPTERPTVERLGAKYGLSPEAAIARMRQLEAVAAAEGLEYHLVESAAANSREAHRVVHLAREHDLGDAMIERLYRAYFTENRSVFQRASLTDLAVDVGLDRDEVTAMFAGDRFIAEVTSEGAEAHELGATGVPFFVIDRKFAVGGAQSPEVFREVLDTAWADREVEAGDAA